MQELAIFLTPFIGLFIGYFFGKRQKNKEKDDINEKLHKELEYKDKEIQRLRKELANERINSSAKDYKLVPENPV